MIEAIIAYIREQGYTVNVRPGVLIIRKRIGEELLSMARAISSIELNSMDWEMAQFIVDGWLREFRAAENAPRGEQAS